MYMNLVPRWRRVVVGSLSGRLRRDKWLHFKKRPRYFHTAWKTTLYNILYIYAIARDCRSSLLPTLVLPPLHPPAVATGEWVCGKGFSLSATRGPRVDGATERDLENVLQFIAGTIVVCGGRGGAGGRGRNTPYIFLYISYKQSVFRGVWSDICKTIMRLARLKRFLKHQ